MTYDEGVKYWRDRVVPPPLYYDGFRRTVAEATYPQRIQAARDEGVRRLNVLRAELAKCGYKRMHVHVGVDGYYRDWKFCHLFAEPSRPGRRPLWDVLRRIADHEKIRVYSCGNGLGEYDQAQLEPSFALFIPPGVYDLAPINDFETE